VYEIRIPVSEFLNRALNASLSCDYVAFLILIARTADAETLQEELIRRWESFDDLTYDQILVISPKTSEYQRNACVRHHREPMGFVNNGLSFGCGDTGEWSLKFWGRSNPRGVRSKEPFAGGEYSPRRPRHEQEKKAALTAAATETARYFGIPERWLPCVVLLSLRDRRIFILSVNQSVSLYAFVRTLLIDYEGVSSINSMKSHTRSLETKRWELAMIRREAEVDIKNLNDLLQNWHRQRDALCKLLEKVGTESDLAANYASSFIKWLREEIKTPKDISSKSEEFLSIVQDVASNGIIPSYLANRLRKRLPRAIRKKLDNPILLEEKSIIRSVHKRKSEIKQSNNEIKRLESEKQRFMIQLESTKAGNPFSKAVLLAAHSENYQIEDVKLKLPRPYTSVIWVYMSRHG